MNFLPRIVHVVLLCQLISSKLPAPGSLMPHVILHIGVPTSLSDPSLQRHCLATCDLRNGNESATARTHSMSCPSNAGVRCCPRKTRLKKYCKENYSSLCYMRTKVDQRCAAWSDMQLLREQTTRFAVWTGRIAGRNI